MIRIVKPRLVVEKPGTHMKYYPQVISVTTQDSYPFAISGATVDVVSNIPPNTKGYAAPLSFDDIVRVQVSVKYHSTDQTVWQDIFHGRIEHMGSLYGTDNQLRLYCSGHEAELKKDLVAETKSYTTTTDAKDLLAYFSKYFSRLTYSASYCSTGVTFPTYDTQQDQVYLQALIEDMEKNSGYTYIFRVTPTYDANKNLSTRYVSWKPLTTTATDKYKIIEGTQRLISAEFEYNGENVVTTQKIYGGTNTSVTPNVQYVGSYTDSALEAKYGKSADVETYDWIMSNTLATQIAQGVLSGAKVPVLAGQITLIGSPEIKVGDLVYIKIPSLELNGKPITGYYYVYRVQHNIMKGQFQTTLDVGRIKKVAEDYIGQVAKTVNVLKCCKVKKCS